MYRRYDCESAGGHEGGIWGKSEGELLGAGNIPLHPHGNRGSSQRGADKGVDVSQEAGKE